MMTCYLKLVLPAIMTNVICYGGTPLINVVFAAGLNDPAKLAAIGLSNICCNIMIITILFGLNAA